MIGRRYILREGSRGGERILDYGDDPGPLLDRRDRERVAMPPRAFAFDVIDTEATDPPESGVVDRCPGCGTVTLASRIEL